LLAELVIVFPVTTKVLVPVLGTAALKLTYSFRVPIRVTVGLNVLGVGSVWVQANGAVSVKFSGNVITIVLDITRAVVGLYSIVSELVPYSKVKVKGSAYVVYEIPVNDPESTLLLPALS